MEKKQPKVIKKVISFIIISYNRPEDTLEVLKNILFFLDDYENYEKEILIINNNSTSSYSSFTNYLDTLSIPERKKIRYFEQDENLGVPGGRNFGMEKSEGDIMIFIDDDAEFLQKNVIEKTVRLFEKNQEIKIIGYREILESTGEYNIPTKSKKKLNQKEYFTNFFIGCGHAIKKDLIQQIGFYSETSLYGAEEYDLSYRTLDAGYKIYYTSEITVLHKKNPVGRAGKVQTARWMFENKMIIAYKYLPLHYIISHFILWSAYFLIHSHFSLVSYFSSTLSLPKKISKFSRVPISSATIRYIRSIGGRLWY